MTFGYSAVAGQSRLTNTPSVSISIADHVGI